MNKQFLVPNALALTTAIIYIVCRILVGLFPNASFAIAQSWFHGIAFSPVGPGSLNLSSFILGLISSIIVAWLIGYLFIKVYQLLSK